MNRARETSSHSAPTLFPEVGLPEGFAYRANAIDPVDAGDVCRRIAALPFAPFEFFGHHGNRRVVSFGWRYEYGANALRRSDAVPDFLLPLRDRAAATAGVPAQELEQILVTEYPPGAGIGWHRDRPDFADVVAFSFLSPCVLRFRRRRGVKWDRLSAVIDPRSVYLLRGPARHAWEHSIPPVSALRYSITMRTLGSLRKTAG